jgi:hypothetical protein
MYLPTSNRKKLTEAYRDYQGLDEVYEAWLESDAKEK